MNVSWFIAKRIRSGKAGTFSSLVVKISIASIAIGLATMIVSIAILEGFRTSIHDKIFSFGGHIQVTKYNLNNYQEEEPFSIDSVGPLNKLPDIVSMQSYAVKTALLKTDEEVQGVLFKGIGTDANREAFSKNILQGSMPVYQESAKSMEVMISKKMADKLKLKLNDKVVVFFMQNPPRARKLIIKGIFQTGLEEFDEVYLIGDLRIIQDINHWPADKIGGYEVYIKDFNQLDETTKHVFDAMPYDMQLQKITDKYVQIFDWLILLDNNVIILLTLIMIVASFNMVATIIILIMERTNMIGSLMALGAAKEQINVIFVWIGIRMISKGLLIGNIVGLGLCALQYFFKIIPLDPANYYIEYVPIAWDWLLIILLNICLFVLISLVITLPLIIISRLKVIRAIKFS